MWGSGTSNMAEIQLAGSTDTCSLLSASNFGRCCNLIIWIINVTVFHFQSDVKGSLKCCIWMHHFGDNRKSVMSELGLDWVGWKNTWSVSNQVSFEYLNGEASSKQIQCIFISSSVTALLVRGFLFHSIKIPSAKLCYLENSCEEHYSITLLLGPSIYKKKYHRNRVRNISLELIMKNTSRTFSVTGRLQTNMCMYVFVRARVESVCMHETESGGVSVRTRKYSPLRCSAQC